MITGRKLHAWIGGKHIGVLAEVQINDGDLPSYQFVYDDNVSPDQFVSWTMPVKQKTYSVKRFFPIFDANLPEGSRLLAIQRAGKVARVDDSFGVASVVGEHMGGIVQLTTKNVQPSDTPGAALDRDAFDDNGERKWFDRLMRESGIEHGLSGVMDKMFSADRDAKIAVKTASHIVKSFDSDIFPHLNTNEFLCLEAAKRSGLETVDAALSNNGNLLFIKRFDIDGCDKIRFEEMGSLCGFQSKEKYMGSYEEIADAIESFVPVNNRLQEIAKIGLLKNIALSVAVGNGDLHMKNLGLIGVPPRLAPTYDVVSTMAYLRPGEQEGTALNLCWDNYSKRWWNAEELIDFATTTLYLSRNDAIEAIRDVAEGVSGSLSLIDDMILKNPNFTAVGEQMKRIWINGIDSLKCKPGVAHKRSLKI